jgi:hypothetical protein
MVNRCGHCASDLEDGVVACLHCGTAVNRSQSLATEVSIPHAASTEVQPAFADAGMNDAPQNPTIFSSALPDSRRDLEGLSGWLVLVAIGLVISPLMILSNTVTNNLPVLTNPRLHAFLETHPSLEGLIVFEIATNLIFVAVLVALNFLFFKKKRSFPTYMILYLCLHLIVDGGDAVAAHVVLPSVPVADPLQAITRSFLAASIWIPYFLVSRRVKVTFVH